MAKDGAAAQGAKALPKKAPVGLLAARRAFDIVGSLLLGSLTGLGGGVVRDLIIGVTPTPFTQPVYLVPPVAAALLVYFFARRVQRFPRTLLIFDAGGLALFCTAGAVTALDAGINPVSAALLGVTTGVGGGLLRDVVANRARPSRWDRPGVGWGAGQDARAGRKETLWPRPNRYCNTTSQSARNRRTSTRTSTKTLSSHTKNTAPPPTWRAA